MTRASSIKLALFSAFMILLLLLWRDTVSHIYELVSSASVFAHGQLVPFVVIALVWSRRKQLATINTEYFAPGIAVLGGACVLWLVGEILVIKIASHLALIVAIHAIILTLFGVRLYKALLFPLFFLFLVVPVGLSLIPYMQHTTADLVIWMLGVLGIPYEADGVLITLSSGVYEVAQACAGVRFLFTSIVTGILLANLVFSSWQRRIGVVLASALIPILANAFRVLGILVIAEHTDQSFAKGIDHIVYGWGFLSFVLIVLISGAYYFSDKKDEALSDETIAVVGKPYGVVYSSVLVLALAGLPVLSYLMKPSSDPAPVAVNSFQPPSCEKCNVRLIHETIASVENATAAYTARYRMGADIIDVSAALFCPLPKDMNMPSVISKVSPAWVHLPSETYRVSLPPVWQFKADHYRYNLLKKAMFRSTYISGEGVSFSVDKKFLSGMERFKKGKTAGALLEITISEVDGAAPPRDLLMNFLSTFPPENFLWDAIKPTAERDAICVA